MAPLADNDPSVGVSDLRGEKLFLKRENGALIRSSRGRRALCMGGDGVEELLGEVMVQVGGKAGGGAQRAKGSACIPHHVAEVRKV